MAGRTGYTAITNGDDYDPANDMTGIYEHFDAIIDQTVANSAALPASGNWVGRTIMAEDTGIVYVNTNGLIDWDAAYTTEPITFTPTLYGFTLGSGGTNTARYTISGGRYIVDGTIILGTGFAISSGVSVSTPVSAYTAGSDVPRGSVKFIDTGSTGYWGSVDQVSGAFDRVRLLVDRADTTYRQTATITSSVPFTWVATDQINYEYSFLPA